MPIYLYLVDLEYYKGTKYSHDYQFIQHVSYTELRLVSGFTYNFLPGSVTALVGETEAEKSTLIRLMLALLVPQRGTVTLYDATKAAIVSPLTRCNLAYAPQGNTLLSGTVRENLLLGKPDAMEAELRAALCANKWENRHTGDPSERGNKWLRCHHSNRKKQRRGQLKLSTRKREKK